LLDQFLSDSGWSTKAFAEKLGIDRKRLEYMRNGQNLPTLVWAFKIERETAGKVPASSWLATEIGQAMWKDPA
jgi:plasmid maintenance system antidote protein VapI